MNRTISNIGLIATAAVLAGALCSAGLAAPGKAKPKAKPASHKAAAAATTNQMPDIHSKSYHDQMMARQTAYWKERMYGSPKKTTVKPAKANHKLKK